MAPILASPSNPAQDSTEISELGNRNIYSLIYTLMGN
jgi:hypothetical protein